MRCCDNDAPVRRQQPVKFLHHADNVADMLDDMNDAHFSKGVIAKWIRKAVEIGDDVGACAGAAIKADRSGEFVNATADVEDGQLGKRCIY